MGTARMKYDKETDQIGKKEERVFKEANLGGHEKKEVPTAYHYLTKIQ